MSVLGLVTIGQTPRPDLLRVFGDAAPHARVLLLGALDGLTAGELADAARPGDYPLLVRLASGRTIEVPLATLVPHVQRAAAQLEADGASALVVVCTGRFPSIGAGIPVIMPGLVVPAVVAAVSRTRRIGIVCPNAAQVRFAEGKWRDDGFEPRVTWAPPGDAVELARAARDLSARDLELVVLDCMGHSEEDRDELARRGGLRTVAAQTIVAKVASAYV